jgi:hypothetical protein
MNVEQLIEWLKTQDQDATVQVIVVEQSPRSYHPDLVTEVDFDPSLSNRVNLVGNPCWNEGSFGPPPNILLLGEV